MVDIRSYTTLGAFDENAEDTMSVAPLTYPAVGSCNVATPTKEAIATRMAVILSATTAIGDHLTISSNDIGEHRMHVVGSQLIGFGERLGSKAATQGKSYEKG